MVPLTRRSPAIGSVLVIVVVVVSVGLLLLFSRGAPATARELDYPVNRAHLSIVARVTGPAAAEIAVTFTPTVPGGHLYATSMPRHGIDGAGRPTLVELTGGDWTADGRVLESVPAREQSLPGFSAPFPLYPDGPVTLRLPIRSAAPVGAGPAEVALTFMVCTTGGVCFPPVEGAVVEVPVGR